jgi:hypothetical protein
MSDYSSPNSNLLLTKTNSIVGIKLTEFPQYKSALTPNVKFQMSKSDSSQLPNIMTKDVDNSLQTMKNIYKDNMIFNTKYKF